MSKTFFNQVNDDMYLTLPLFKALDVIDKMKKNPKCLIHLITHKVVSGQIKTTIKYHYWSDLEN